MSSPNVVFVCKAGRMFYTVNKGLVPEWPTFTDVYNITVSYKWWPRRFRYHTQPSVNTSSSHQCRAHCEQTFQDGSSPVSYFCVVVDAQLQPQLRRDILLIFAIVSENSTELSSSNSSLALFRVLCCGRVALQPQLRQIFFCRFCRLYHLRSLRVVSAVLLLSSTPATVAPTPTQLRQIFLAGFVVFTIFVRFV